MRRPDLPGAPRSLTSEEAEAIYDLLVEEAGASDHDHARWSFVRSVTTGPLVEWRFAGQLGFGGKFYADGWQAPRIGCYPEHCTPEREAIVERTNAKLAALFQGSSDA